jgi:lipid A 3-O-deacylase
MWGCRTPADNVYDGSRALRSAFVALCAAILIHGTIPAARAGGLVDEVRLSVLQQNVEPRLHDIEFGQDINGEVLFAPLFAPTGNVWHDWLFSFRPTIGGTYNFAGKTDIAYAGITWDLPLGHGLFWESSFGGAVHRNGPLKADGTDLYGCTWNFHESLGLGYNISDNWDVMLVVDHMSNARLCDPNRGLTNAGVRIGYRLN